MKRTLLFLIVLFIFISCGSENYEEKGNPNYVKEINDWHSNRVERLKNPRGWLNLVGLYWLKQGENTFGSDAANNIVFPKEAPSKIGSFILTDSTVTVKLLDDVDVLIDSQKVNEAKLNPDTETNTTIMNYGSLEWYIIRRSGDMYGIRIRDLNDGILETFPGVERFPVNDDWDIKAKYEPFDSPKEIEIPTILGTIEKDYTPGKLIFSIENKEYTLFPTSAGDGLFIIFADQTSGVETYGAGRFLYVDGPDSNNIVNLDFNKSYNPPCAFSKHATCPLPPKENQLNVRITAGEKNYGEGH